MSTKKSGKGARCPGCTRHTFYPEGSHRKCTQCGYIGWTWHQDVERVGKGPGNRCFHCGKKTLHDIATLPHGEVVRRCTVCNAAAIQPA